MQETITRRILENVEELLYEDCFDTTKCKKAFILTDRNYCKS